ncbi:MAG TPA: 50S ribosomal protein L24 [Phycisphaerae bacterium]|jgi:large subunit ribosomal protein L24|nr:50S ribosomal protein L24 [Phycisphaerae bacterium]
MAARIKKDDIVFVRSGDNKGKTGKVLRIVGDKVIVEGVNVVWKHLKPTQQAPKGGRIQKEAPIHMSKVQPVDPKTGKGTRVKFTVENGEKHRTAAKTGNDLGLVGKA